MSEIERRTFSGTVELREAGDGESQHVVGHAAVFGERSEDLGGFVEEIDPHFFDNVLGDDVRALWNHDANYVFGRTRSGTLKLGIDERGLHYDADPPDTQWARDAMVTMQRGDVDRSSFGFQVKRDRWEELEDGTVLRTLLECERMYDVSPVTFPAYPQTSSGVRARYQEFREFLNDGQEPVDGSDDEARAQARLDLQRRKLKQIEVELQIMEGKHDGS